MPANPSATYPVAVSSIKVSIDSSGSERNVPKATALLVMNSLKETFRLKASPTFPYSITLGLFSMDFGG